MNISIDREILLENLNTIARGLPVRSPMPILTGIKLYATDTDLYMIIDVKTFDRYYEEMLSEDQVIKELIARGWKLEENSLEKDK